MVLTQRWFLSLRKPSIMSRDVLACHNWVRKSYWHLVGSGQRCCLPAYKAQDCPATKGCPAENGSSISKCEPRRRTPALKWLTDRTAFRPRQAWPWCEHKQSKSPGQGTVPELTHLQNRTLIKSLENTPAQHCTFSKLRLLSGLCPQRTHSISSASVPTLGIGWKPYLRVMSSKR